MAQYCWSYVAFPGSGVFNHSQCTYFVDMQGRTFINWTSKSDTIFLRAPANLLLAKWLPIVIPDLKTKANLPVDYKPICQHVTFCAGEEYTSINFVRYIISPTIFTEWRSWWAILYNHFPLTSGKMPTFLRRHAIDAETTSWDSGPLDS